MPFSRISFLHLHTPRRHTARAGRALRSPRGEERRGEEKRRAEEKRRIKAAVALCTRICPQISPKCILLLLLLLFLLGPPRLRPTSSSASRTERGECMQRLSLRRHPSIAPSIHPSGVSFHFPRKRGERERDRLKCCDQLCFVSHRTYMLARACVRVVRVRDGHETNGMRPPAVVCTHQAPLLQTLQP